MEKDSWGNDIDPRIVIECDGYGYNAKITTPGGEDLRITKIVWSLDARDGIAYVQLEMLAPRVRVAGVLRPKRLWRRIVSAMRYIFKGKVWI